MLRRALLLFALSSACAAQPGRPVSASSPGAAAPSARVAPPAASGPATFVVTLAPGEATAVLRGPFVVTAINPGSVLELAVTSGADCGAVDAWFSYSGGGVAAAAGELLCARSVAAAPLTHGFSGDVH
jgi:hypothetical protein